MIMMMMMGVIMMTYTTLDNCALLGYYAESSGNFLPTFRDNQSVPSSGVKYLSNRYCSLLASKPVAVCAVLNCRPKHVECHSKIQ